MKGPMGNIAKYRKAEEAAVKPVLTMTSPPGHCRRATLLNVGANKHSIQRLLGY